MSKIVIEKTSIICSPSPVSAPFHIKYQESENMPSASSACHGLQSCLEPLKLEPSVLMHPLVPSKQALASLVPQKQAEFPHAKCSKHCAINKICIGNRNGEESTDHWASLHSLTIHRNPTDEAGQIYVHPLVKRSISSLSTRSLEMCTESLGSETGSSIIETAIDELSPEKRRPCRAKTLKRGVSCKKDGTQGSNFPPPLTSISGSDGVQVRTHREGGRLVIRAFTLSINSPCFQAERKNGRLRLSFNLVKDGGLDTVTELDEKEGEKEEDENEIHGGFWEGKGGKEWSNSSSNRCNGDGRLPSLPFCVAIS